MDLCLLCWTVETLYLVTVRLVLTGVHYTNSILFRFATHNTQSSPVAWSAFTCDDQCDLSGCDSLDIPDDTEGCAGQECGKQWCAGGQVCHIDVPYQCTEGSARFGCSTDEYQWSLKVDDATCSKCCDMASC